MNFLNTQANRPLELTTSLGRDALLLLEFDGREAISQLFEFELEVLAEAQRVIAFDKLLGQPLVVRLELPSGKQRFFHGLCNQVNQEESDRNFTHYGLGMVPDLWLLTKTAQSRIFQQKTIPDILKEVLEDLDTDFQIQGKFEPRDYCVQYRETDFAFASRLMEEEGIFYFFTHTADGHKMVLANTPGSHPALSDPTPLIYETITGGNRNGDERIHYWQKNQLLCSGKYTLFDHSFELPHKHLEAEKRITASVQVGRVEHKLFVAENDQLEIFNHPGEYAQRFDGVAPGGGDRAGDLAKIFQDNKRTVAIRMEQEAASGLLVQGASQVRQLAAGCKMTVATLAADTLAKPLGLEGDYVLTGVLHSARQGGDFRSGSANAFGYHNTFTALPLAQPFRPPRVTPKPTVKGTQTAVVVGPPGEEIFPDKYGRVKVQFHWDREGKNDLNSSCWVRVAQFWAGKRWGAMFIPRAGHEVLVDYLEGDPDQPIIIGSLYNAQNMPHYELPKFKTLSYIKSDTTLGSKGFNELRFEDKKGKEQVFIHSQDRMDVRVRGSLFETCGGNRDEVIGASTDSKPGGNHTVTVGGDHDLHIQQGLFAAVEKKLNLVVAEDMVQECQANRSTMVKAKAELNAREITLEALTKITLKVGSSFIVVDLTGVTIQGPIVRINSGGAAVGTGPATIDEASDAAAADTGEPGFLERSQGGGKGRRGRKRRTLTGFHAPAVTRNLDGTFQVGRAIKVKPSPTDPNFAQLALADLATMGTTVQGRSTLNSLDSSGRTVTLQKREVAPGQLPGEEAGTRPEPNTTAAWQAGHGAGLPFTDPVTGNPATGTGTGTDSVVSYDPSIYPVSSSQNPASKNNAPSDVALNHELTHANNLAGGRVDTTPTGNNFDNVEERNVIGNPSGPDNDYRDERNVGRRKDHHEI